MIPDTATDIRAIGRVASEAAQDARRYRWLAHHWPIRPGYIITMIDSLRLNSGMSFDEAVDCMISEYPMPFSEKSE
jgi:hypothetical protein